MGGWGFMSDLLACAVLRRKRRSDQSTQASRAFAHARVCAARLFVIPILPLRCVSSIALTCSSRSFHAASLLMGTSMALQVALVFRRAFFAAKCTCRVSVCLRDAEALLGVRDLLVSAMHNGRGE